MSDAPPSEPESPWQIAARERNCYCGLWGKEPANYESQGLSPGYCGFCERCGAQGHTRHFPGPVPYTGSWCDRCYTIVKWTWPLRMPVGWIYLAMALGVLWAISPVLESIWRALH